MSRPLRFTAADFRPLFEAGLNNCQIGRELGLDSSYVLRWRLRLEFPAHGQGTWTRERLGSKRSPDEAFCAAMGGRRFV